MDTLTILIGATIIWLPAPAYVVLIALRERRPKVEPEPTSFNCCEGCVYHGEMCFCPFEVHPIPVNNGKFYLCTGRESLRGLVHRQADEIIARVWA